MSTALAEFLNHQGWEDDAARAGLIEHWREIVGEDVAEHVHVESWNDGQLVLRGGLDRLGHPGAPAHGVPAGTGASGPGPGCCGKRAGEGPTSTLVARWPPGGQRSWAPRYLRLVQAGQGATQKGSTQAYNIH